MIRFVLQRAMGGWAHRVGSRSAAADVASLNAIQEALASYREISVSNRRDFYVNRIEGLRWDAAKVTADRVFISLLPKYVFEAALVIGGFLLAGVLFATQDSVTAVGTLALFLAAGSRVMPSLLRLQTASLSLRNSAGTAVVTFDLADELGNPLEQPEGGVDLERIRAEVRDRHEGFEPTVDLAGVSVTYPGATQPALNNITLTVTPGSSLALIGPSGAGKSTLADVILGVLHPDSGSVRIGGFPPEQAIARWPGGIAYVPQEVLLANETVRRNVALGLPDEAIDDDLVWEALERAHLDTFLREQRDGLDTHVGESGLRLSGGQRQRLGIARALYTRPRLLVLDEATSALDAETETAITETIRELEGDVTTVLIAHRLSTVKHVDVCVYLQDGSAVTVGEFSEVVKSIPALDKQTRLLGL